MTSSIPIAAIQQPRSNRTTAVWIVLSAAVLCSVAILNGYPLLTPDSGIYVSHAVKLQGILERPPYYSLFLLLLHLKLTLWLVPIAQNLITCYILFRFLRLTFPDLSDHLCFVIIALTSAVSYLPWASNKIMTDIFTPLILLLIIIFTFKGTQIGRFERSIMVLLLTMMITFHQASGPFAAGLLAMVVLIGVFQKRTRTWYLSQVSPVVVCVLVAVSAQTLYSYVVIGRLTPSPASPIFLLARLIGDGTARAYLAEACPITNYSLCSHQDELIGDNNRFLWDSRSPKRFLGTAAEANTTAQTPTQHELRALDEASAIVAGTLARYPLTELTLATANTGRQLIRFGSTDTCPCLGDMIDRVIRELFPLEHSQFEHSLQNRGWWCSGPLSTLQIGVVALSVVLLLIELAARRFRPGSNVSVFVVCLAWALLLNAALMGALSGPEDRYQARIIWLVPLTAFAMTAERWTHRSQRMQVGNVS